MSEGMAVVIGGAVRDIGGAPYASLVAHDSNPGRVRTSLGGVGRNIAHNLRLLGAPVHLLTAIGEDDFAPFFAASCREIGINIDGCLRVPGGASATYLFVLGHDGDMEVAVSDMDIFAHITPEFLAGRREILDRARVVVFDTNLPAESIAWLAEHCAAPLFADPVSTAKAPKLAPVLDKIHTLKPNRIEAELLSGVAITDDASLECAAKVLLDKGLQRVFLSLGAEGVYCAEGDARVHLPCVPGGAANATGCGDAFVAALAWAHLQGLSLTDAGRAGLAAAAIAMEGAQTINPDLCVAEVLRRGGITGV